MGIITDRLDEEELKSLHKGILELATCEVEDLEEILNSVENENLKHPTIPYGKVF